jgi:hypothetical protein
VVPVQLSWVEKILKKFWTPRLFNQRGHKNNRQLRTDQLGTKL